jgi:pimeloyl-ACP methyl ester carboxylesterase
MNQQVSNQKMHRTRTLHRTVTIDGLSIFYRESGDPSNPKLVLLHGWPSSSHQYRNLIPALADHFHIVAPDYPGFGNSDMPSASEFSYTFEHLSEIMEDFLKDIGFTHFGLFMQDYGGPVGLRIISRHADWLEWLIIQNTNSYDIGFTKAWDGFRNALWKNRTPETEGSLFTLLRRETIKEVYLHGHQDSENISPDNWNMDSQFMERPNAKEIQMDLFYDYRTNVALYPKWQKFLSELHILKP